MNSASLQFGFSSPCLGNVISLAQDVQMFCLASFRPHVLGMFFHSHRTCSGSWHSSSSGFRPHVWGMFFHQIDSFLNRPDAAIQFSSPCLGNVLSQDTAYETAAVERFSSPCLGNLLSLWSYWG